MQDVTAQTSEAAEPEDLAAVLRLVGAAERRRPGGTLVIAIDGPSGSGKTVLGDAVAAELGAAVVHLDELYPGWDGLVAGVDMLTTHVLEPVARGEAPAYPVWDWDRSTWGPTRTLTTGRHLVVEGCGSTVGAAGRLAHVRVWVEAPPDLRRARGIARDGEVFRPHWERWAAQEEELFAADGTRDRADLLIDTGPADKADAGATRA